MAIDRDKVLQAAQSFVEKKKYDRAVLEYQKIIQEDPNDARTLLKIGDLQSKQEKYAEAIASYERVGKHYATQGFALKAIAVYKQIREIIHKHIPQLEERYSHISPKLAELYQQLGLTSDALAALDEVATRYQRAGRDSEAIEVFHKIVQLDPTNPLPHLRLAEALSRGKDTDGAATEFGIAASQLIKHNRRDDALKVIERLLHHRPDPSQARVAAELYLARAQPNDGMQALAKLQICFQSNPKDLDTLALLARAFVAIGQANKGIEVHKEMARIAREQGKAELFNELIDELQRTAPNDEGVRQLVASRSAAPAPVISIEPPPPAPEVEEEVLEHDTDDGEVEEVQADELVDDEELPELEPYAEDDDFEAPTGVAAQMLQPEATEEAPEMMVDDGVGATDAGDQIAELVAEADSLRRRRQYTTAVDTLRMALEMEPRSLDVRFLLRDVLLEAGRPDDAVDELLVAASMQLDSLDGEAAARSLQEVLNIDPANQRAIHTLRELGYDVPEGAQEPEAEAPAASERPRAAQDGYDADAPLPSYDLEEMGPEDVSQRYSERRIPIAGAAVIDDPFQTDSPLPSFPLEAPESDPAFELVPGRATRSAPPASGSGDALPLQHRVDESETTVAMSGRQHEDAGIPRSIGPSGAPIPELEDALEEADFFASRGLYDDARAILTEQLSRLPSHPLLRERMHDLDAQEQSAAQASGTRAMPVRGGSEEDDRSFDIAASLDALESLEGDSPARQTSGGDTQSEVDVEQVFAQFKEGVSKQLAPEDSAAHYDMGIAYKEIGRHDDAIKEFEIASRDPEKTCVCEAVIGTIHLERNNVSEAIQAFLRGLNAPVRTAEQEMVLSFELGAAYELKKMYKDALSYFQRVARREPNYRDVKERVRRMSKLVPETTSPQRAVGADDDFDRAFEEIIGSGKLP